ncbi:hypothetical protein JB92DRAFT_3149996 [Gautieria morchelliformis]|nr:hypothetical protein JB92DRAFT_3149996 [Gautieria morchelliformis]
MTLVPRHSVQLLFGPLLIGAFFSTILYGVVVVQVRIPLQSFVRVINSMGFGQAFIYYQTYKRDATWIRYFVLYLFICKTLATGFDIGMMYEPLVLRYATPRATTIFPIMLKPVPIVTVFISTPVQLFVCWRIKRLSGSRLLPTIICALALSAFAGGISTTVAASIFHKFADERRYGGEIITWLVSSAAADICIMGSLVWSLHKRRTGYSATDDLLNKLIRLTLQTGAITAISATLDVVSFFAAPDTAGNFIWDFSLSKLYTNALLSTLNARAGWNNLTGDQLYRDNVLFGEPEFASSGGNHLAGQRSNVHSVDALELRFRSDNSLARRDDGRRDIESEISVTKVVERFEEIPPVTRN